MRHLSKLGLSQITISPLMVQEAIKISKKSKALGPDQIGLIYIHNLGQNGINFLTDYHHLNHYNSNTTYVENSTNYPTPQTRQLSRAIEKHPPYRVILPIAKLV